MLLSLMLFSALPSSAAPAAFDEISLGDRDYWRVVVRASEFPISDKTDASLAIAPDGRIGLAWQSRRQLNGHNGVYMREFAPDGTATEPESHAGFGKKFHEYRPSIVFGNKFLALYESPWKDDSGSGIFAGEQSVPQTTRGDQSDVASARLADGSVLVVWSSQISRTDRRVFGRLLNGNGAPIGKEFRLSNREAGNEALPTVTASEDGAVVSWQVIAGRGESGGIWAARFNGSAPSSPVLLTPHGVEPSLAPTGTGIVAAWSEPGRTGMYQARATLLSKGLSKVSDLHLPVQRGYQSGTAVATRADGQIAIAWNLGDSVGTKAVWVQMFTPDGRQATPAARLHPGSLAEASGKQRVAWSGETLCIAWSGDAGLGDSKAAHLTLIAPKTAISLERLEGLDRFEPSAIKNPSTSDSGSVQFVAQAGPHEPPTYNPNERMDPWGLIPDTDGTGFTAVVNTGWTPPDPHIAVGPNHIGVMTNGEIAFFLKNGTNVFRDEIENSFGFWGALGTTNFVFDPEIIYDVSVDRWMAMANERGSNGRSYFLLAVSDDDDPTGTWFKYRIDVTILGGGGDIDSPNISTDDECVYLSADFFTGGQKYLIYILRKADLLQGLPNPLTRSHLITGQQSHGIPMTFDAGAPQYLIEHFEATSNTTVRLHAIQDPLGTPTRTTFTLAVPTYGRPENPPQAGTTVRPTAFDSRFWSAVYRNGSLWATHHINSNRVLARWYEIRMNNWPNGGTPVLVQSGDIDPGGTVRTFFSSIAVDPFGNAAVVSARSSPTEFISMYRAARKSTDPLGTMPHQEIMRESDGPYTTSRWGDYSGVVVDPADNRTFWGHHEYAAAGSWRTWVAPFAPPSDVIEHSIEQIIPIAAGSLTGGLPEIAVEDGVFLVVASLPVPLTRLFSSTVDYLSTAGQGTVAGLEVRFAARSSSGVGFATIALFNYQSNSYDTLGVQQLGPQNTVSFTLPAGGEVNRYIDPSTRRMRTRMTFRFESQPTGNRPPVLVDEVKFITRS